MVTQICIAALLLIWVVLHMASYHHIQEHVPGVRTVPYKVQLLQCCLYFMSQQAGQPCLQAGKTLQPHRMKQHWLLHTTICSTGWKEGQGWRNTCKSYSVFRQIQETTMWKGVWEAWIRLSLPAEFVWLSSWNPMMTSSVVWADNRLSYKRLTS